MHCDQGKPDGLEIRSFYEKEGAKARRYDSAAFWERRYHQKKASLVSDALSRDVIKNRLVLDAGCGSGELSFAAERLGAAVVSLDLSKSYLKRLNGSTKNLICASCEYIPFQSRTFDLVLNADVIEHVYAYDATLKELHRVSNREVIITTPCNGLVRKLYGKILQKKLIQLDKKVGHLCILSLSEFKQRLLRFEEETDCRSYHVTQPLADNYFPDKLEPFVAILERIGNLCVPNQGTISVAILTRRNTQANDSHTKEGRQSDS